MNTMIATLFLAVAASALQEKAPTRVATSSAEEHRGGEVLRVYEVRDILLQLGPDFPAPTLGVTKDCVPPERAVPATTPTAPKEPTAAELEARCEANGRILVDIVRRHAQPPVAQSADDLRCVAGGTLIANLTPEQHAWTSAFLERLRNFDGCIEVDARFLTGPAGVMQEWGFAPNTILADAKALAALEERIKKSSRFDFLTAPRLTVLPAQRASLSTLNEVTFVRDWNLQIVEPGQREIGVPNIGVIHEGLALDVRALPLENDVFRLDLQVQNCKVRRPIRSASIPLGRDAHMVEIALPEADIARQEVSVLLASGTSAVLVGPGLDKSQDLVLIVSARRVPRERR